MQVQSLGWEDTLAEGRFVGTCVLAEVAPVLFFPFFSLLNSQFFF